MNSDEFNAFYGIEHVKRMDVSERQKERLLALADRPVTARTLQEFCKLSVEPWRLHYPYAPDDMPPPEGDQAALARVWSDPEIEIEVISADQQARLPAESDPWD